MCRCRSQRGFSLFELAFVLALTGLFVVASLVVARTFWEERRRAETRTYLAEAKAAVLAHAGDYGKLPGLDITASTDIFGDGHADPFALNAHGWLPFLDLKLRGRDAYASQLKYCARGELLQNRSSSCSELKDFFDGTEPVATWYPKVWREGMAVATPFNGMPVAVVILSPGRTLVAPNAFEKRLNDNGTPLDPADDILVGDDGAACGDEQNYLDTPRNEDMFDDMLVYITVTELYAALGCAK